MDLAKLAAQLLEPPVLLYFGIVIGLQLLYVGLEQLHKSRIVKRRRSQKLTDTVLMNHGWQLKQQRLLASLESLGLLVTVVIVPFIIVQCIKNDDTKKSLGLAFITLLLWLLFSGSEAAKSFFSGLVFKTLVAFKRPFQIGDRVTLKGIGGKVQDISTFYVTLTTSNDDLISIPTSSLWGEVLSSTNAGERSSMCVMNFYLAPFVTRDQRQAAENAIWDAIQASVYYEPAKPMQIYLSQLPDAIQLTAKAYVASTYNEPLLVSDVTRAFLNYIADHRIPLGSSSWDTPPSVLQEL